MWPLRGPSKAPQQYFWVPSPNTHITRWLPLLHSSLLQTQYEDTLRGRLRPGLPLGTAQSGKEADRDTGEFPAQVLAQKPGRLPGVASWRWTHPS